MVIFFSFELKTSTESTYTSLLIQFSLGLMVIEHDHYKDVSLTFLQLPPSDKMLREVAVAEGQFSDKKISLMGRNLGHENNGRWRERWSVLWVVFSSFNLKGYYTT